MNASWLFVAPKSGKYFFAFSGVEIRKYLCSSWISDQDWWYIELDKNRASLWTYGAKSYGTLTIQIHYTFCNLVEATKFRFRYLYSMLQDGAHWYTFWLAYRFYWLSNGKEYLLDLQQNPLDNQKKNKIWKIPKISQRFQLTTQILTSDS